MLGDWDFNKWYSDSRSTLKDDKENIGKYIQACESLGLSKASIFDTPGLTHEFIDNSLRSF